MSPPCLKHCLKWRSRRLASSRAIWSWSGCFLTGVQGSNPRLISLHSRQSPHKPVSDSKNLGDVRTVSVHCAQLCTCLCMGSFWFKTCPGVIVPMACIAANHCEISWPTRCKRSSTYLSVSHVPWWWASFSLASTEQKHHTWYSALCLSWIAFKEILH